MKNQFAKSALCLTLGLFLACSNDISTFESAGRQPVIDPDYRDILVPPNIAPLNFKIKEEGRRFQVVLAAENLSPIRLSSASGIIKIPPRKWRKFLDRSRGQSWTMDIYARSRAGRWQKFQTITNRTAELPIDSHLVYRLINPGYVLWWQMGIYQRDVTSFDEKPIFTNRLTDKNCMNCHAFCLNDPKRMMFHTRASYAGTLLIQGEKVQKINTATDYTMSAGVYPAWHPGGKHLAFSVNKIYQKFHAHQDKSTFVYDTASDLVIYDIDKNQVTTSPLVSTARLENLPAWHPNGRDLYFISAPAFVDTVKYSDVKYDLMRTSYNIQSNEWGEVDSLLTAAMTGLSITFPKVSPTGRYLMFTMSDYGYFTIYSPSSDLWLYNLDENTYSRLAVNSDQADSYHSWSSDGHWFVFASKRRDGLYSRLYFSYVDEHGKASRPFLLPQENPEYYDTFLLNYNVPELITGPVKTSHRRIAQAALGEALPAGFDATVNVDALSGATKIQRDSTAAPYQSAER